MADAVAEAGDSVSIAPRLQAGQRVIVTGAGGFLGRRLVERLRAESIEAVALSRADGFALLDDKLPLKGVEHVFHLAAETGVVEAWQDPARFHLVNSHGTVRVLDQCRLSGVSFTYVGAYIYGVPQRLPIAEDHPVEPNNPYAFSKWMAEQACQWYAQTYSMPITAIRLFNVYGHGQSDRFLIARILDQALDPSIAAIELMDLAPKRDYLYVGDAVEALLCSRPLEGYELFNVGSGVSHSVAEVVETVFRLSGITKPIIDKRQARPNEIPDVIADCARIRAACGWTPHFSLDAGIRAMLEESTA